MDCEPCRVRLQYAKQHLTVDFHLGRAHLAHAAQDLFASTSYELLAAGHPDELAPLGFDRLARLPHHYEAACVSRATHKLTCSLHRVALCGEDLRGGELTLHQPSDGDYVLLLSDGHLLLHDSKSEVHCAVYLVATELHCRHVSRTIDLSRFVRPGELCLVQSRAPLTVKFGPHSNCALWTTGTVRLDLRHAQRLSFWCDSDARYHPLAWQADSTQLANRRAFLSLLNAVPPAVDPASRVQVYRRLFDQTDARCDVSLDASRQLWLLGHYDVVAEPPPWQWDPLGLRQLPWLRQHGTFDSEYAEQRQLLESICVMYRGDAQWPEFYVRHRGHAKRLLSVQRMRYQGRDEVGGGGGGGNELQWYYVNALYFSDKREQVVAFFYLNLEENRLLLIPPH